MYIASLSGDIMFGVLDILRGIGISIVNMVFSTIDVLYNVAQKINSLNFIQMLENIENSPFTKIFNAFFVLSFIVLMFFAIWKITFRILDADNNDIPLFEIVKEIAKCVILIFSVYLIFNTSINIGINLSNAIYNTFTEDKSTIGDKMKTAYLSVNEACYKVSSAKDADKVDKENVSSLKDGLSGYADVDSAKTMKDFETLIRNGKVTATNITDSGSFAFRCQIYKKGIWNDGEDYAFNYNFLFGIVIGVIFLFAIGFAVLMLGRRQLEIAFLMVISPIIIATSIGRKEQRSALYQSLASLVLQAGALMLLIGLTSVMFNAIQNSPDINKLSFFTKTVAQSVLYLGCAMMLLTGSTSINRFIGDNVSANSGRDAMMALSGLKGGIMGAGATLAGGLVAAKRTGIGAFKTGRGIGQFARGGFQTLSGMAQGVASVFPATNAMMDKHMANKFSKGLDKKSKGMDMQNSSNPFARAYGRMLESIGNRQVQGVQNKWDFVNGKYNSDYIKSGITSAQEGINNIKEGFGDVFDSIRNIGNPYSRKYTSRPHIRDYGNERDSV